ncbi:hypothetical protein NIES37_69440 (plasmid) [Tolypothrix tenuis PCC 7101]|uniref:Uncharacterized protein n=1 Tax=Tolypothrix tenuis PCC 7101 TaxID=231146 RepID=A0A1Z4NB32_9CYAN|nr:hypothetical protein [Aulosira sp. FACHB-113]BAZ02931.1 hypothetical protein NIES37_69440 [Tolypothrix tenuis PCC 7101]BAZ78146.1 hypothetical protein NIES50_67790 [Aulosira laxa NIES-50]
MSQTLITQEFGIIIAAKNHKPTILNPEFLQYSGIVPTEWELARQPIYTQSVSQVAFTNGVVIVAEPTRVMFIEAIEGKAVTEIAVPAIAKKYVETLPNVEYEAVGINPRGYVAFEKSQDAARLFLAETLLSPGDWQEVGNASMRATLNLAYTLERGPLYLSINEAMLRNPDETTTPIVLFSGSFSYEVKSESSSLRKNNLDQALNNWQADLSAYQDIISSKFLGKNSEEKTIVPDVFSMSAAV